DAGQARIKRAVRVSHDHDPVPPAVKAEVVGRGEATRVAGFAVVDEHAVAVADDSVRVQEKAKRDGAALGIATNPAQYPVVAAQLLGPAFGLVAAMGTSRIHQRLESFRLDDQLGL